MTNYEKQASDFLAKTGTTFEVKFDRNDFHFEGDNERRDIYDVTFKRGTRSFALKFGQSIVKSGIRIGVGTDRSSAHFVVNDWQKYAKDGKADRIKLSLSGAVPYTLCSQDKIFFPVAPTAYDVLACLTKYDPWTFEDFCSAYGYDPDSRTAKKTYKAVCKEWADVCRLWSDSEIEQMQEIQ